MNTAITISAEHLTLVRNILHKYLPPNAKVWIFGSRAGGTVKQYSDLDLAIDISVPLSFEQSANLKEAFIESDLPYKVDIVDWQAITDSFREIIRQNGIVISQQGDNPYGKATS